MPQQIFISHSKADKNLLDELAIPFANTSVKRFIAGFEDLEKPVNEYLQKEIRQSRAIFVVLGPNARAKEHTKLWIAWEVGIATQFNIDVWVFEDVNSPVHMPIPSLTDYLLWDSKNDQQKRELRDILENEFLQYEGQSRAGHYRLESAKEGKRNVAVEDRTDLLEAPITVICPYDGCGAEFNVRFDGVPHFNCPVCRQAVTGRLLPKTHLSG